MWVRPVGMGFYLRNYVSIMFVLEERSGGEIQCQHQESTDIDFDFRSLLESKSIACICFRCDLLTLHFQLALKYSLDDASPGLRFTPSKCQVKIIQKPA